MQNAAVATNNTGASQTKMHSAQQTPITFMRAGDTGNVVKVRGNDEVHHHLENLGFVAGAPVRIVCEQAGNVIVEVKGAQVALDRTAASKIIAE